MSNRTHHFAIGVSVVLFSAATGGCFPNAPQEEDTAALQSPIAQQGFTVGMPFAGSFDRFALASPSSTPPHHVIYSADWATDVYTSPGTSARFHSTARGKVRRISTTCASGGPGAGGTTVSIDLIDPSTGKVIGRAHYGHLAGVQVKEGEELADGKLLGTTRQWPQNKCYDVSNAQGVHLHFEAESIAGSSCWIPESKTDLGEGSAIARLAAGDKRGRCSGGGGGGGGAPPFRAAARPTGGPFQSLHIKSPIIANAFVTQCSEDASGERVWTTSDGGPEPSSRWAVASYPQLVSGSCGRAADGTYPLVFRSHHAGDVSGWVGACVEDGKGTELVFRIDAGASVDGHPAASFAWPQISVECP